MIPAICNTPRQTRRTEFHFSALRHGDYVCVVGRVVVCGCVPERYIEGAPKIFRKLLRRRNYNSGNITRQPDNYSKYVLVFLTFARLTPRVLHLI
jgi:hypothetical protein